MKKIVNSFWVGVGIAIIAYVIYKIARNSFTDHLMGDTPRRTRAVIINDKNYMPNQPVKAEFTYSYRFVVKGEIYTGNSHDTTLRVGDTVEVQYNSDHPNINKPLNPKE
jgi:regulator of extracellular matrix RemA (YlzA/DUF370 family)